MPRLWAEMQHRILLCLVYRNVISGFVKQAKIISLQTCQHTHNNSLLHYWYCNANISFSFMRFNKCIKRLVYFSNYITLVHARFLLVLWYDTDRINGSLPILTHSWQVHTRWWLTRNRRCVYLYVILFHLSFVHEMDILVHWSFFSVQSSVWLSWLTYVSKNVIKYW